MTVRIDLVGDAMREKVKPLSEPFELALRSKCCSVAQLSVGRMMWLKSYRVLNSLQ